MTGLVLAGGRGSRMGGVDKGLVEWRGKPLVAHVIERFAPQVVRVAVSANRNAPVYAGILGRLATGNGRVADAARGLDPIVVADADTTFAGPLAGIAAALATTERAFVAIVPCDAPRLPLDLVARLRAAIGDGHGIAVAAAPRIEPLFCLVRASARAGLARFIAAGGRAAHRWIEGESHVVVPFDDASAFANVNSASDLASLDG